jgi:DNA repair protein RadC
MKKMKEVPVRDRPREKIATKGASVLSDNEVIEAIIGRGTRNNDVREISNEIMKLLRHHSDNLLYEDILEIDGIGPTKASQIVECLELGRRHFNKAGTIIKVTSPEDVLPLVAYLTEKRQE